MKRSERQLVSPSLFLQALFAELEANKLLYVVLRNYGKLTEVVGHDIDLLISERDLPDYRKMLLDVAHKQGWQPVRIVKRYRFLKCYFFCDDPSANRPFLQIDTFCSETYKGVVWLPEQILADRVSHEMFYIPAPGHEAADLLLKELLGSARVKKEYRLRIAALIREENQQRRFLSILENNFGCDLARFLLEACNQTNWTLIEQHADKLRRALKHRSFRHQPLAHIGGKWRFLRGHLSDMFLRPSGFFVVLIGPDGSGKTSVALELKQALDWTVFQKVRYFHGRFAIIPELKVIKKLLGRLLHRTPPIDPIEQQAFSDKPHGFFRAMVYLFYYTLDYTLGHLVTLCARGKGELIVCDRYYYDYLIQWTFKALPTWLPMFLLKIIPKPDVVIFLCNEPEAVYHRKKDIPVEEINRQTAVCRKLTSRLSYSYTVQTDVPLAEVTDRVITIITKQMEQKLQDIGIV